MSGKNEFCSGESGMVMIMEGFQWALKGESSCINLFFASWTLNTSGKFIVGLLGVVFLGMGTEGISRIRHGVLDKARGCHPDEHLKYTLLQTGLHGLHAFSGYMLMLATMTFACEMMLAVIIGLMIGYYAFGRATVISANPCCAFLEEECGPPQPMLEPLHPGSEGCIGREEGCCHAGMNSISTQGNHRSHEITISAADIP